ncbi:MAG TPA: ATP-binding cassette domain-containing protein [Candidatus Hydrogenedentes bacterium]|nr:ATP-binding cassette domain-containing protein [Candidatus Hydrogenedentota bacterium]
MSAPVAEEVVIRCDKVTIAYGEQVVVREASIEVPRGAFLPFVGPNGAGKTTLLKAIMGLVPVRSGSIFTPFASKPPGYVPQQKSIYPLWPVSAREIVAMGLYPRLGAFRKASPEDKATIDEALGRFDLRTHAGKTYGELSGGMKQKLLLARAFASGADVLIMDEPTSELDKETERDLLGYLHRLSMEHTKTVLFAHHGLDLLDGLADLVAMFDRGRVRMVSLDDLRSGRERSCSTA